MNMKNQGPINQSDDTIFVLDIGTRSIIGLVGTVEEEKLKVIAIESADHSKRSMIDGQIEDISSVAKLAAVVKERIEAKLGISLSRVCVAAAGRALKTERTTYEIDVPDGRAIDDDLINQLESGAIEQIEQMLHESANDAYRYFHLVGYSAVQYYLDDYPISSLSDHHGSKIKADILATFLPSEVVDSLYAAMEQAGLEVASLTLEPIAAINAAIPENLRLLNLAFADIGAGTSDIAVCKDGNVIGYTMTTLAGDEITEALMREYLIDFDTAEQIKLDLDSKKEIYFTDIMGFEQTVSSEDIQECIADSILLLSQEIAQGILDVNGGPPSAVFLAGGGSKLKGILEGVRNALQIDDRRIAIAGNNFKATSFSKEYDLNNPELATPLGIAVSTGLNLINDSYHLTLNGKRARLFRNGELNILNVLTMNGYQYRDLFGRSGSSIIITVNGKRSVLYGEPATNSTLTLNGQPAVPSDLVKAGDILEFIPARAGEPAQAKVSDVIGEVKKDLMITVNGELADLDTELNSGDVIVTGTIEELQAMDDESKAEPAPKQEPVKPKAPTRSRQTPRPKAPQVKKVMEPDPIPEEEPEEEITPTPAPAPFVPPKRERRPMTVLDRPPGADAAPKPPAAAKNAPAAKKSTSKKTAGNKKTAAPQQKNKFAKKDIVDESPAAAAKQDPFSNITPEEYEAAVAPLIRNTWHFTLNDKSVTFPAKPDKSPYLLLDMLQHSGLDFDHLTSPVILAVNGQPGTFQQELKENDVIIIRQDE